MDISIETITPKQAEKYLQFNTNNRTVRNSMVRQYAKDMKAGNWRLTHQGIAFNCDGTLLDGQHRLLAIIEAGVAVQMVVARRVESETQMNMDQHGKRSAADAIGLARRESISKEFVSVIRAVVELRATDRRHVTMTNHDIDALIDVFRKPNEFVASKMPNVQRGVTSAPVKAAIVLAWFYVRDIDRLAHFCDVVTGKVLADGVGDKAAVVLREWLLRSGGKTDAARKEAFLKTQRAIVAFLDHKEIGKLYGTATYYPWPLVDPVRGE